VDFCAHNAYDTSMSSLEGSPTSTTEQSIQNEATLRGIEVLQEAGVGLDVAGVVLKGPRPECEGTLAEMIGSEGHSDMRDGLLEEAKNAQRAGLDPGKAVLDGLRLIIKRDENKQPVRINLAGVKKK
jgi:hypothetical protein